MKIWLKIVKIWLKMMKFENLAQYIQPSTLDAILALDVLQPITLIVTQPAQYCQYTT